MSGGSGVAGGGVAGGRVAGGRVAGGRVAGGRVAGGRRATRPSVDVLIVSLGATGGLKAADRELCDSISRAGAKVELVTARRPPRVRTLMLTDLMWALAARDAAVRGIDRCSPRAIVYSSVTAALLWPRRGAIRFDSLASGNRPHRHGLWQRPLERWRLSQSPLLLPWSELALNEVESLSTATKSRVLPLPTPIEPSGPEDEADGARCVRDIAAITYAANPRKKGLDRVLAAWAEARREGETLIVTGTTEQELCKAGISLPSAGVQLVGMLARSEYRALLRRSRVFVTAPRREDHGIAQLEALADGCMLVTTISPGPYVALPIAKELDGRLVSDDLCAALRCALDDPRVDYVARAQGALAPLRRTEVDRVVSEQMLPQLLLSGAGS